MFKLDNDFLTSLGLGGLPVDEKNKLLQMIYERLEMNVGMRLAEKMSDQQLDEFEAFIDQNDEAGALKWLETNFPNYKDVVAEELEKLRVEVTQAAPQILAAQTGGQQPAIMSDPMMPGVPQPQTMPAQMPVSQPSFQQSQPQQPSYQPPQPVMPQQPLYDQPMQHMQTSAAQMPQTPTFTPQQPASQPFTQNQPVQQTSAMQPAFGQQPQPAPEPQIPAPSMQPAYPQDQPAFQLQPDSNAGPTLPAFGPSNPDPFALPAPGNPQQPAPGSTQQPMPQYNAQPAPGFMPPSPQPAPGFGPAQPPVESQQQFTPPPSNFGQ